MSVLQLVSRYWTRLTSILKWGYMHLQWGRTLGHHFLLKEYSNGQVVTGQLADKPTRGQWSRGLVHSWTNELTTMLDEKFGVSNHSKCDFVQTTLCIRSKSKRVKVGFRVQTQSSISTIFFKNRCHRVDQSASDWPQIGLSASCPVSGQHADWPVRRYCQPDSS